jgi:putative flippase GtrA
MSLAHWNTPQNRRYLIRFLVIGACSTTIDLGAYLLLAQLGGVAPAVAKTCSYLTGMTPGFLGNKFWTFGSKRRTFSEPAIYFSLYVLTLLVNVVLNSAALAVLGRSLSLKLAAFVLATTVTTMLNFLGLRLIAFRQGIQEAEAFGDSPAQAAASARDAA